MKERHHIKHVADAILESIHEKLRKLDVLEQINGRLLTIKNIVGDMQRGLNENIVGDMERGLNSLRADLQKVKTDLGLKADNATVEALKDEIEVLKIRRNNLAFFNIPEKVQGGD